MPNKVPLESVVVKQIVTILAESGYRFIYKTHGSAYQPAGLPDIVTIDRHGRFVGLEVKRPKIGRLTKLQRTTLERIMEAGGYAAVVTSIDEAREAIAKSEDGERGHIPE